MTYAVPLLTMTWAAAELAARGRGPPPVPSRTSFVEPAWAAATADARMVTPTIALERNVRLVTVGTAVAAVWTTILRPASERRAKRYPRRMWRDGNRSLKTRHPITVSDFHDSGARNAARSVRDPFPSRRWRHGTGVEG